MGENNKIPTKRRTATGQTKAASHRFGGRATAGGVNYEARVAAYISTKMLVGCVAVLWDDITGADVVAVAMQAREAVDDVVVSLRNNRTVYISAKERSGTISLTAKSQAFTQTIESFVKQFLKLTPAAREQSRFLWAVPSSVGARITHALMEVLTRHRTDFEADNVSVDSFLQSQDQRGAAALSAVIAETKRQWKKQTGKTPDEKNLRQFLRMVYVDVYDFSKGYQSERQIHTEIAAHLVRDPKDAKRLWLKLEKIFIDADEKGTRVTPVLLRRTVAAEFPLKLPPDCATDIARLQALTTSNLQRLKQHTILPFGAGPSDCTHIPRDSELYSLVQAAQKGHLLITGEPGGGKSGLVHDFVNYLRAQNVQVVLLLAEDMNGIATNSVEGALGLTQSFKQLLRNWPSGARGFIVTDALDALRDSAASKVIRQFFESLKNDDNPWTIVASVREFDLKYGRDLRDLFPGDGTPQFSHPDFDEVAHFHVPKLTDSQLAWLANQKPQIQPFLDAANKNTKSQSLHRSPFYLRIAAELLGIGVTPARVADWSSPALLLRSFWARRVEEGPNVPQRQSVITKICECMVDRKSPTLSAKEVILAPEERAAINDLRSHGIFEVPIIRHKMLLQDEVVRFSHHLLHDYAIARALIPTIPDRFCDFVSKRPLLPVFYRPSFLFALEEIWDADDRRESYWDTAIQIGSLSTLHGITRIAGPILAAKRVETASDLAPLLKRVCESTADSSAPFQVLKHLAAGLQDADTVSIQSGADAWCDFAVELAKLLPGEAIELPLVHILARLNSADAVVSNRQRLAANVASRASLKAYLDKPVRQGWPYALIVAIETICRTFEVAASESEALLMDMMSEARLAQFPHDDLFRLAHQVHRLGPEGDRVIIRLFEAAFEVEPEHGKWEPFGTQIMPMRIQTSDQWHGIRYSLANYIDTLQQDRIAPLASVACIVANCCSQSRLRRRSKNPYDYQVQISFRGRNCTIFEDQSHIWAYGAYSSHREQNRIVSHFSDVFGKVAEVGEPKRIEAALDAFAERNETAWLWFELFNLGATHPKTLGVYLAPVLVEPFFLVCLDTAYAAARLLAILHAAGNAETRERFERLILELPQTAPLHVTEKRTPTPKRIEYAQNRLLGVLNANNLVLQEAKELYKTRNEAGALPENRPPREPEVFSYPPPSEDERLQRKGIDPKEKSVQQLIELRDKLQPAFPRDSKAFDAQSAAANWHLILKAEKEVEINRSNQRELALELWGFLVNACEAIARFADWPSTSNRWIAVRRILLTAAHDPLPEVEADDSNPDATVTTWSCPCPRVDAAEALPLLAYRLGQCDAEITDALRRLSRDPSQPVRFHLAENLSGLWKPAPEVMWSICDDVIQNEKNFFVLSHLVGTLDWLFQRGESAALGRIATIAHRSKIAAEENPIHQHLASAFLFNYLRTGNDQCKRYIDSLIAECDTERVYHALTSLLHGCRAGRWLTAGSADTPDSNVDAVRKRTWDFFLQLVTEAQKRLHERMAYDKTNELLTEDVKKEHQTALGAVLKLMDGVAAQLFFVSGAFEEKKTVKAKDDEEPLTDAQTRRLWFDAKPVFQQLVKGWHPHTTYELVQTLNHVMKYDPRDTFLLAAESIRNSAPAGFQREPLAVTEVVKLIQHALADHRDLFRIDKGADTACLDALLAILDLFVEAGWPEARQLTHRLEEIYR